jgi:uncharacterized membrane protein YfcA
VAGGGSFISFPALMFTGVPATYANATNTVALWPGSVASIGAYRGDLQDRQRHLLFVGVSLIGGILGAILLIRTPQATFVHLVPYLLLLATVLFAIGGKAAGWLRARAKSWTGPSWLSFAGVIVAQLAIATYGGYFGGGIGILMLAVLALAGLENIHQMNAVKTLLATCINGVAVLIFVFAGTVVWPKALLMIVGAILGGYFGAHYARRLDPLFVRRFVLAIAVLMTAFFFLHG